MNCGYIVGFLIEEISPGVFRCTDRKIICNLEKVIRLETLPKSRAGAHFKVITEKETFFIGYWFFGNSWVDATELLMDKSSFDEKREYIDRDIAAGLFIGDTPQMNDPAKSLACRDIIRKFNGVE